MLVVLSFSIMVSCSKDSDNGGGSSLPVTKENLIGGWVYDLKSVKSVFVFRSNDKGEFIYFVGDYPNSRLSYTFSYKIKGDNLILSDMITYDKEKWGSDSEYTYPVTLYKDKLLLKDEFGIDTYTRDDFWLR